MLLGNKNVTSSRFGLKQLKGSMFGNKYFHHKK